MLKKRLNFIKCHAFSWLIALAVALSVVMTMFQVLGRAQVLSQPVQIVPAPPYEVVMKQVSNNGSWSFDAEVFCSAGNRIIAGGFQGYPNMQAYASYPLNWMRANWADPRYQGWRVSFSDTSVTRKGAVQVYAVCQKIN
jgi:hypothetical protein